MFGLGVPEVAVIVIIVVLLFGPRLLRGVPETIKELRKVGKELEDEDK